MDSFVTKTTRGQGVYAALMSVIENRRSYRFARNRRGMSICKYSHRPIWFWGMGRVTTFMPRGKSLARSPWYMLERSTSYLWPPVWRSRAGRILRIYVMPPPIRAVVASIRILIYATHMMNIANGVAQTCQSFGLSRRLSLYQSVLTCQRYYLQCGR